MTKCTHRLSYVLYAALLLGLLSAGCATHSGTGALVGGGAGAGAGALIGKALGNTGAGAVVGGLVGAVTGAAVGDHMDRKEEAKAAAARAVGLDEIIQMSQRHIDPSIIITQIRTSGTVYHLNADTIYYLKQNGVSDAVIREMQMTAVRYPRGVIVADPPPVGVGVGVGYYRRWR